MADDKPTYSGDTRVVKHLLFPYFVEEDSDTTPGARVFAEHLAHRGDTVKTSEMRELDLKKGERLGSFFNDEELSALEKAGGVGQANLEAISSEFSASEAGPHEISEYIVENQLNVDETVALSGGDAETAQRVMEAESIASGGDSRKGVIAGLEAVIARATG